MSKVNIADVLLPAQSILEKVHRGESIEEEERMLLTRIMPVKIAYDELMRQMRKYQETLNIE